MTTSPINSDPMSLSSDGQTWDPASYSKNARFVSDLGMPVLDLLAPKAGERILDLGCGDGVLTKAINDAGARVVGIDASAEQVAAARARGVDARILGGEELTFNGEFDAVFSNAALHWIKDQGALLAGVWRALRDGGRFVAEMGGAGNVAAVHESLYQALRRRGIDARLCDPWYFPGPDEYGALLAKANFSIDSIDLINRPTPIPGPLADWLDVFAQRFLSAVPAGEQADLKTEVESAVRAKLCDTNGKWTVDYVRLRFKAIKAAG
ncbi:MAG: methyltransferase domain-containing protein [Rhodospirillales bacterium]|nr:methyltransferase domain-containing protein [Rhodospirillales bacterium]MDP6645174.1 methyltransferase domain-containing protein [Rhodospirillales bacterium]MDP6841275.1 methyltransferase domain-containing protein [Rhodospirillales bacterium]